VTAGQVIALAWGLFAVVFGVFVFRHAGDSEQIIRVQSARFRLTDRWRALTLRTSWLIASFRVSGVLFMVAGVVVVFLALAGNVR
jgi:hypothetical protein